MRQAIGRGLRFFQRESVTHDSCRSAAVGISGTVLPAHRPLPHPCVHAIGVAPLKLRQHFLLLLASRISAQYANRSVRVGPLRPIQQVVGQSINASGTPPVPRHWPQPDVSERCGRGGSRVGGRQPSDRRVELGEAEPRQLSLLCTHSTLGLQQWRRLGHSPRCYQYSNAITMRREATASPIRVCISLWGRHFILQVSNLRITAEISRSNAIGTVSSRRDREGPLSFYTAETSRPGVPPVQSIRESRPPHLMVRRLS
jgi:hypothetical protein